MRISLRKIVAWFAAPLFAVLIGSVPARAQFGLAVPGVGRINRWMGGAALAAPIDAAGSLFWNPASISGLGHNEMVFGTELLIPRTTITSHVPAGALGPGTPGLTGTTGGNNGVFPLPAFALVYKPEDYQGFTYGIGFFQLGGFAVNYPGSHTNPVLMPPPPLRPGAGAIHA